MMAEVFHAQVAHDPPADFQVPVDPCPVPISPWQPTHEEYHRDASVSSSMLKAFRKDPGGFFNGWARRKKRRGRHFSVGSAFGDFFCDTARYDATVSQLTGYEATLVAGMIAAVEQAEAGTEASKMRKLLRTPHGRSEWAGRFVHVQSGLICRLRVDRLVGFRDPFRIVNAEVKTSAEDSPEGFLRSAERFGYYEQADLYEQGLATVFEGIPCSTVWCFISKIWPHRVWCHTPDPDRMAEARAANDKALGDLAEIMNNPGAWRPERRPWEMLGGSHA
jgi:hypothetical protein